MLGILPNGHVRLGPTWRWWRYQTLCFLLQGLPKLGLVHAWSISAGLWVHFWPMFLFFSLAVGLSLFVKKEDEYVFFLV